jgi:hypothetical protein
MVRLRAFAGALPAELTAHGVTPFEVELFEEEDELRIDTGPCMIIVRITPAGGFRTAYEIKSPRSLRRDRAAGGRHHRRAGTRHRPAILAERR